MKLDDDLGLDREDQFPTDDEENQAERVCEDESEETESDKTNSPSRNPSTSSGSVPSNIPSWPQSYRKSMDVLTGVTPPHVSFLRGSSVVSATSSLASVIKRHQSSEIHEPLLTNNNPNKGGVPTSTLPCASSHSALPINELPTAYNHSSYSQAVLNGINILCGIGLLTTPYAIKEGGWLSLLVLLIFGIICCYTGVLVKKCLESSPGLQTYPDIGQAAFGMAGRLAISVVLYVDLYASAVEYVIMMSDNLSTLFPNAYMQLAGIRFDAHQLFSITSTIIVLPTVWLRDLSILSYLSVGGVVSSILVVLCLLWVGVVGNVGFHPSGRALDLVNLPVAIGIYGFGFSGHSVFPNIYTSMKDPSQFPSVLIVSFFFCGILYIGVAICGYLMFGDLVESQYTLNMPIEFTVSKVAVWTAVVNPMTKFAMTLIPVALSLEELMPPGQLRSYSISLVVRTILVISTLIVALTVPFFGFVMALMGSLLAMLIAVIFPCACYLRILYGRLSKFEIAACLFTIIVGLISACFGTYSAISRIADKLGK